MTDDGAGGIPAVFIPLDYAYRHRAGWLTLESVGVQGGHVELVDPRPESRERETGLAGTVDGDGGVATLIPELVVDLVPVDIPHIQLGSVGAGGRRVPLQLGIFRPPGVRTAATLYVGTASGDVIRRTAGGCR